MQLRKTLTGVVLAAALAASVACTETKILYTGDFYHNGGNVELKVKKDQLSGSDNSSDYYLTIRRPDGAVIEYIDYHADGGLDAIVLNGFKVDLKDTSVAARYIKDNPNFEKAVTDAKTEYKSIMDDISSKQLQPLFRDF